MKNLVRVLAIAVLSFTALSACDDQGDDLTPFDEIRNEQATDGGNGEDDGKPD